MVDLIIRKALMKYMRDYKWEFALNSDFSKAIEMVDVQPAVELPTWIPCSERLPNEYDYPEQRYRILASCSDGIVRNATIKTMLNGEKHYATGHVEFVYEAWMPLPEPYKGE